MPIPFKVNVMKQVTLINFLLDSTDPEYVVLTVILDSVQGTMMIQTKVGG